jgi:hypothetical protein
MGSPSCQKILPMPIEYNTTRRHHQMGGRISIIHTNNIALDHNIFLFNKFTQNYYKAKTLPTQNSCINFSQCKDQRFIRPPIEAPHLTLIIIECNPHKDITSSRPTILIQGPDSNIFDHIGAYITTIPSMRLQWL